MITLTVKCFAQIREITNTDEIVLQLPEACDIDAVIAQLVAQEPGWAEALDGPFLVASNHELVATSHRLYDGDEVAFFPPVTGG